MIPDRIVIDKPVFRPTAPGCFAAAGVPAQDGWTPFDMPMDSAIVLKISAEGREYWGLLDSGASMSVIEETLALQLGLKDLGTVTVQSDAGRISTALASGCELVVGSRTLAIARFVRASLPPLSLTTGRAIAFVLGQDVFDNAIVDLDFSNRRIAFGRAGNRRPLPGFRRVPLGRASGGRRTMDIRVEALKTRAVFDLGSGCALMIAQPLSHRHGLTKGRKTSSAAINTLTGRTVATVCRVRSVDVGGFRLHDTPADILPGWVDDAVPANVGLPILQRFHVVADFAADAVWLARAPADFGAAFARDRSGLGVAFRGDHLEVVHVAQDSPAAAAGWTEGERIVSIHGRPIDAQYGCNGLYRWRTDRSQNAVTLTTARRTTRLDLHDYY